MDDKKKLTGALSDQLKGTTRSTIEALITFGWLPVDQQDDLGSIARAFRRFAGRALDVARNGKGPDDPWYFP